MIYVKLTKYLYGTLQEDSTFWKYLTGVLKGWIFKLNMYNEFVANVEIDGHQCTILWHANDTKISHIDTKVADGINKKLKKSYDKEELLILTQKRVHEHLKTTIYFSKEDKVVTRNDNYVSDILEDYRNDMDGESSSLLSEQLFVVNEMTYILSEGDGNHFHTRTETILLLPKRSYR